MVWKIKNQESVEKPDQNGAWKVQSQEQQPQAESFLGPLAGVDSPKSFMDYLRGMEKDIGMGAINFATGGLDMAARSLGGGPEQAAMQEGVPGELLSLQEGIDMATGGAFIPQNARQRTIAEGSKTAGEFGVLDAIMPGSGTLLKGTQTGALFGTGSQLAEEEGAGGVGQFIAGAAAAASPYAIPKLISLGSKGIGSVVEFGKEIWNTLGKEPPNKTPKFLTEVGTPKAAADLELSHRDLVGRTAKISKQEVAKIDDLVGKVTKPSEEAGVFNAAEIEKDILKSNQDEILKTVYPESPTKKEAWEGIIGEVDNNYNASKEAYKAMYESAEEGASKIKMKPQKTMNASKSLASEMKGSLISTGTEKGVSTPVNTLIRKLIPSNAEEASKMVADLQKEGLDVEYKAVLDMMDELSVVRGEVGNIPVDRLIKTKRSISRILDKKDIIPAPVDMLSRISKSLKEDILEGLGKVPKTKELYQKAEKLFGETQKVFNNDAMIKARKSANPEKLSSFFSESSNLEKLNKAVGGGNAKDLIDRLVVENISKKGKDAAREMARESREYIGEKGQKALDKLLEYGDNLTNPGQTSIARSVILDDVQKAASTGSRPDRTLNLMKNKVGRKIVIDTLNRSPSGKEMLKSLKRMSVDDLVSSVSTKDGLVDFEKVKDIYKNPETRKFVKDVLGEEGDKVFQRLEYYGKNMADNLSLLKNKKPSYFRSLLDKVMGPATKAALTFLIPATKGASLLPIMLPEAMDVAKKVKLFRILESKEAINAIEGLGKSKMSVEGSAEALKRFAQTMDRLFKEE